MRWAFLLVVALASSAAAACAERRVDPLALERGNLTVYNQSDEEWREVEIWLNHQFRVTTPTIAPDQRFQVHLNQFVAGFGQRFDWNRMQVKDLRLKARRPGGEPVELVKAFERSGLERVIGG
jgi:hypothetical protein